MTLDIAALRQALSSLNYSQRCTVLDANAAELLDAADERDRLRSQRNALLAAGEAVCDDWQAYFSDDPFMRAEGVRQAKHIRLGLLRDAIAAAEEAP